MDPISVKQRDLEISVFKHLAETYLDLSKTRGLSLDEFTLQVNVVLDLLTGLKHPQALEELFGMGAVHPDPYVRVAMVRFARDRFPDDPRVRTMIVWLTHDPEDFVAFEAIRTCGTLRIHEAIRDLMAISGRPSERLTAKAGKPVGVGHVMVIDALVDIFGTRDIDQLRQLEDAALAGTSAALAEVAAAEYAPAVEPEQEDAPVDNMIYIPPGPVQLGVTQEQLSSLSPVFQVNDVCPSREAYVEGFYMDRFPVTNAEYDRFVADVEARGHRFCHPDEPPHKDHTRNTWRDPRYEPDHPVAGVDWYDAYAYARWAGEELPSEEEWEKAARGDQGFLFPWGNAFDPDALNWAGRLMGTSSVPSLEEWRAWLKTVPEQNPLVLTTRADRYPKNCSPYGVCDLLGNLWEWTRTNFITRTDMEPTFQGNDPVNFITNTDAFAVLRGGAWSSIPELTTTFFRGKDILTDRHNEIGFRCVLRRPEPRQ